ncbi:cold-shock protein [Paracoccus acridae]|uniref:Cold-shock protein n=2 Tax=Paracoccus acridae TaxID=1795310 RepID=A0ABQ1VM65_9RHOB|nr:cold-shock protein [Paracoccus acridae]
MVQRRGMMARGTVKWFNTDKGYGFIAPETGGGDVFVHITAVQRAGLDTLRDGQKVSFELETGRNGKTSAVDLQAF